MIQMIQRSLCVSLLFAAGAAHAGTFVIELDRTRVGCAPAAVWNGKTISGGKRVDTLTFDVGMSMTPALYRWIQDSFDKRPTRKDGAVIQIDASNRAQT